MFLNIFVEDKYIIQENTMQGKQRENSPVSASIEYECEKQMVWFF